MPLYAPAVETQAFEGTGGIVVVVGVGVAGAAVVVVAAAVVVGAIVVVVLAHTPSVTDKLGDQVIVCQGQVSMPPS